MLCLTLMTQVFWTDEVYFLISTVAAMIRKNSINLESTDTKSEGQAFSQAASDEYKTYLWSECLSSLLDCQAVTTKKKKNVVVGWHWSGQTSQYIIGFIVSLPL